MPEAAGPAVAEAPRPEGGVAPDSPLGRAPSAPWPGVGAGVGRPPNMDHRVPRSEAGRTLPSQGSVSSSLRRRSLARIFSSHAWPCARDGLGPLEGEKDLGKLGLGVRPLPEDPALSIGSSKSIAGRAPAATFTIRDAGDGRTVGRRDPAEEKVGRWFTADVTAPRASGWRLSPHSHHAPVRCSIHPLVPSLARLWFRRLRFWRIARARAFLSTRLLSIRPGALVELVDLVPRYD